MKTRGEFSDGAVVSGISQENDRLVAVIRVGVPIPTYKEMPVKFVNVKGDRVQIEFYSRSAWSNDSYRCGAILAKGGVIGEQLRLTLEIDAGGAVVAELKSETGAFESSQFQINRKFAIPAGYCRSDVAQSETFESETFDRVRKKPDS